MMDCDLELVRGVDKGPLKRGTSKYIRYSALGNVHRPHKVVTGPSKQTPTFNLTEHPPEIILLLLRRRCVSSRGECSGGRGANARPFLRTDPSSGF